MSDTGRLTAYTDTQQRLLIREAMWMLREIVELYEPTEAGEGLVDPLTADRFGHSCFVLFVRALGLEPASFEAMMAGEAPDDIDFSDYGETGRTDYASVEAGFWGLLEAARRQAYERRVST